MSGMTIRIDGLDNLQKKLIKNATLNDVKRVVKHNGAELTAKMVRNASFNRGYQTGQTKRSIKLTIKDGGFTAAVGPETDYSPYLEYGTRFMAAQPFIKPSLNAQQGIFKSDIAKLMK